MLIFHLTSTLAMVTKTFKREESMDTGEGQNVNHFLVTRERGYVLLRQSVGACLSKSKLW